MSQKPYREYLADAICDCNSGYVEYEYGKWYETYLVLCPKCNGKVTENEKFSEIHNLGE